MLCADSLDRPRLALLSRRRQYDEPKARKEAITTPGTFLLIPSGWFNYFDSTAMPLYVTAEVGKKCRADKPAMEVKMVGDGKPQIKVQYYIDKHPYYATHPGQGSEPGVENKYLMHAAVQILSGAPPTDA